MNSKAGAEFDLSAGFLMVRQNVKCQPVLANLKAWTDLTLTAPGTYSEMNERQGSITGPCRN